MAHCFECAAAECSKVSNHTYASNLKLTICHCWHMRNAFSNRKPEGPPDGISDFWGSAAYLLPIRSLSAGIAFKNIFLGRCFFETSVAIPGMIIHISQTYDKRVHMYAACSVVLLLIQTSAANTQQPKLSHLVYILHVISFNSMWHLRCFRTFIQNWINPKPFKFSCFTIVRGNAHQKSIQICTFAFFDLSGSVW